MRRVVKNVKYFSTVLLTLAVKTYMTKRTVISIAPNFNIFYLLFISSVLQTSHFLIKNVGGAEKLLPNELEIFLYQLLMLTTLLLACVATKFEHVE